MDLFISSQASWLSCWIWSNIGKRINISSLICFCRKTNKNFFNIYFGSHIEPKKFSLVPNKFDSGKFNLVSKSFNLVPKSFKLVQKKINLVPPKFQFNAKKFAGEKW